MSKKAVGYTRLSQESDTSIPDQKCEIRELAEKEGFEMGRIYDDGQRSSGFDAERPEYLEMQAMLEEDDDIDAVIVRDRDRLSRDKRERSLLYYDLDEWDVDLWITVDADKVDFSNDEDWLIEMIRAYMDDVAKRREIAKAKKKIRERVENGFHQGRPKFGMEFDSSGEHLVPSDEFDVVIEILTLRSRGYSYSELEEETEVSQGTIANVLDRLDYYIDIALAHGYDVDLLDDDDEQGEAATA